MPPYTLLVDDSNAAALKELNVLALLPNGISVLSVNKKLSPNKAVSTVAAALDVTEWPLVNSGNGGV